MVLFNAVCSDSGGRGFMTFSLLFFCRLYKTISGEVKKHAVKYIHFGKAWTLVGSWKTEQKGHESYISTPFDQNLRAVSRKLICYHQKI